jgi:hypothetical protein
VKIFVAQLDAGGVVGLQRNGRVDAVALDLPEITERVGAFIECVEPHGDVFIDRLPGIDGEAPIAP